MKSKAHHLQDLFKNLMERYPSPNERKQVINLLEKLCKTLDPFLVLTAEQEKALKLLGIEDKLNPYELTNTLVFLLEESIQEQQKRNAFDL
jgi:hypothetical protein